MRRLLFVVPIGLLFIAYIHESFTLLMASGAALFVAVAVNFTYLRNFLLVLSSITLTWAVAEALLSTLDGNQSPHISFYENGSGRPAQVWRLHEEYGAMPRPGEYNAVRLTDEDRVVYDARYTIGNDGFRYTPQSHEHKHRRAYFLGDSATFGEGLDDDETLPFHWAALNPEYDVTNLAMSAWGLHQAYVVWRDRILDEGALVFVQTAPWHADRSACIPEFSTFSPRFELGDDRISQNGRCRVILGAASLERVLKKSKVVARLYDAFNYAHQARKFELYIAIIEEMQDLARERGQCLILAFNKALDSYFQGTEYNNERLLALLAEKRIEVVDVTLADRKEDLDPSYYIADDGHPSGEANRAKAGLLSAATSRCAAGEDTISRRSALAPRAQRQVVTAAVAATAGTARTLRSVALEPRPASARFASRSHRATPPNGVWGRNLRLPHSAIPSMCGTTCDRGARDRW